MTYETSPEMSERKRARRERLLKAAVRLFGRRGYHATTVPAIVRQARSSIGSFYSYFRNKEDVFGAALDEAGQALGAAIDQQASAGPGVRGKVRALSERCFLWLTENPAEARILLTESSGLSEALGGRRRGQLDSLAKRFEAALEGSVPGKRDRETAARCFLGATIESSRHWLETKPEDRVSATDVASRISRFQQRGVA